MKTILHLRKVTRRDTASVGSKAAALGELLAEGFRVPNGYVLTTDAYARVLEGMRERIKAEVTPELINDPTEIESLAGRVREWIEAEPWPADLQGELVTALDDLNPLVQIGSFAARTSLPTEELATAFGSGVQRATLGLVGVENVELGAARCWGALWTSRSMYYRQRKRIPHMQVSLAVLIQPMINADSAGTVFTTNPLTNDRDEMQIDSIWGLGAPLIQARVKPDRFLVGKKEKIIRQRTTEEKVVRLSVAADGTIEQQVVAPGEIASPSLTDDQIAELATLAARIESHFGEPQHIEWAREKDEFYILQSRPSAVKKSS